MKVVLTEGGPSFFSRQASMENHKMQTTILLLLAYIRYTSCFFPYYVTSGRNRDIKFDRGGREGEMKSERRLTSSGRLFIGRDQIYGGDHGEDREGDNWYDGEEEEFSMENVR